MLPAPHCLLAAGVQPGSRAAPPMHVGGISPREALQYLGSLGVEGQAAEKCVGLVGGSLLLLERCAGMVRAGVPFAGGWWGH